MAYSKVLNINGWTPPAPKEGGVIIGREKIWSQNTNRVASGLMVGDIIAIKNTLEISWAKLRQADVESLDNAINNIETPFFNVAYCDETGTTVSRKFYAAPNSYTRKVYTKDDIVYTDISIRLIER